MDLKGFQPTNLLISLRLKKRWATASLLCLRLFRKGASARSRVQSRFPAFRKIFLQLERIFQKVRLHPAPGGTMGAA